MLLHSSDGTLTSATSSSMTLMHSTTRSGLPPTRTTRSVECGQHSWNSLMLVWVFCGTGAERSVSRRYVPPPHITLSARVYRHATRLPVLLGQGDCKRLLQPGTTPPRFNNDPPRLVQDVKLISEIGCWSLWWNTCRPFGTRS